MTGSDPSRAGGGGPSIPELFRRKATSRRVLIAWGLGCLAVYSALFGTGMALYGRTAEAIGFGIAAVVAGVGLFRTLPRIGFE